MNHDDSGDSQAFKALSIPIRRRLFELIERAGPTDLKSLIRETGMKEPTIRHHLLVLERANLVHTQEDHQGSPGRPRTLFSTTDAHWPLGFPKRQYAMLAQHLLEHIIESEGAAGAAEVMRKIGAKVAQDLLDQLAKDKGSDEVTFEDLTEHILPVLDELGSVVDVVEGCAEDGLAIRMRNCIFYELALAHHGVTCEGHAAIFETLGQAIGSEFEARVESCLASGDDACLTCISRRES